MNTPPVDKATFFVSGICCAAEELLVRKRLDALVGPQSYTFNPITGELVVHSAIDNRKIIKNLQQAGFDARNRDDLQVPPQGWRHHPQSIAVGAAMLLATGGMVAGQFENFAYLSEGLLLAAIVLGGWNVAIKAWKSVRNFSLDMHVLMTVAVLGALFIGKWGEAGAVIILFDLSLMLESYSMSRTRAAIQSLMKFSPDRACMLKNGVEIPVPAKDVSPGDTIVIKPGDRVSLDGDVIHGTSFLDQSLVTGEAGPVAKNIGDRIFAGSVNSRGSLHVRVTARFEDTTLARIVHLVEEAQLKRAPVQNFIDRFARVYTPAVLGLAAIVALVPPLVLQEPHGDWLYRALVLLVIACPCALVISTPVTIVGALTNAARHGILVKGGKHLETLDAVTAIAFDKTGTLTHGTPRVTDVLPLNSASAEFVVQIAAALEQHSEHHLASAVLAEAARIPVAYAHMHVEDFEALPGRGVKARINGSTYHAGNLAFCKEAGYCSPPVEELLVGLSGQGKTAIVIGKERSALGIIAVQDTARQQIALMLHRLKRLGIEHTVLLSGDSEPSTRRLASEVGVDDFTAGLLPGQKVDRVEQLALAHGTVAMVGDGLNDAPALAASSVGIAMGVNGIDATIETADVVLMSDDIGKLPFLFSLSRKTSSIIRQNIVFALLLKLLFLVLSVCGLATLWMAVLADDGAALIVILNSLRTLSHKEGG